MAAERLNLPAHSAIVGLHARHSLQRKSLSNQVGPHTILRHRCHEAAASGQFARHVQTVDGFDPLPAAFGLNVLVDQFLGSLALSENAEAADCDQHNHCVTHASNS